MTREDVDPVVTGQDIRVCIVGLYAYSLFARNSRHRFGGAEVRSYLFATGLARTGRYDVSYVVFDWGQARQERFEGVTVWPHPGYRQAGHGWLGRFERNVAAAGDVFTRTSHFPFRRMVTHDPRILVQHLLLRFHRRLSELPSKIAAPRDSTLRIGRFAVPYSRYAVYEQVEADVYCAFGTTNVAGEVAVYCRHRGKPFVLFLAAETNLDVHYQYGTEEVNRYGDYLSVCRYAIDAADLIVAQTEWQRDTLKERFGRSSRVIRNPIRLDEVELSSQARTSKPVALWVGRADHAVKMPMRLVDLAEACPDVQFTMVLALGSSKVAEAVRARKPANLVIRGFVSYSEIDNLFAQAFVFVNTSPEEGFPNTFLQAGNHGVPVLSFQVDPDNYIRIHECGIVAGGDFDALVRGLRTIQADHATERRYGRNHRAYVERFHDLGGRIVELDAALQALLGSKDLAGELEPAPTGETSHG